MKYPPPNFGVFSRYGLGEVPVPEGCWDKPELKACQASIYQTYQSMDSAELLEAYQGATGGNGPLTTLDAMAAFLIDKAFFEQCVTKICLQPGATDTKVDQPGNTDSCTGAAAIKRAQASVGANPDGIWGPASTAALAKSGRSFQDAAGGCSGNPPAGTKSVPGGGGGSGAGGSRLTLAPKKASLFANPMTWLVVAAALFGGIYLWSEHDRKRFRPNRSRRTRRTRR